jgi:hypothetical protein
MTCQAACQGSCQAQANLSCQFQCESSLYAQCETTVQGGCNTACSQPSGAIFCDGNYVQAPDVSQCESDLEAQLNIHVSGSAQCSGGTCTAHGQVSCGQIAPGDVPPLSPLLIGAGLAMAAGGVVRRRIRAKRR